MEYFVISAKFVPLKYYTLSSQLRRLTSFSVGLFGSANSVTRSYPVMRKSCRDQNVGMSLYAGTVKGHNICKRHVAIDTGVKQTEHTIFPFYFNGTKIVTAFKCVFEVTMPKLSVNFENHISKIHKKQHPSPIQGLS